MWEELGRTGHWQGEIWNRRKNGEVFPERMSLSSVRNARGEVTHYVCLFTDISQEHEQRRRLEVMAHTDPLTGLPNRTFFAQQLEEAMADARARGEPLAVLLVNLDRFKDVNDSYGHAVGDQVLRHIAARVQEALRPGDLAGRLAGDEIGVIARRVDGGAGCGGGRAGPAGRAGRTPGARPTASRWWPRPAWASACSRTMATPPMRCCRAPMRRCTARASTGRAHGISSTRA